MIFGNKYISKVISSVLLLSLLLIHSVKLLHSHPNNSFGSKDIHTGNSVVKNNSDCSICNYQLAKDIDHLSYIRHETYVLPQNTFNQHLIAFHKGSFYPAFESRGPPAGI
jgi:hypothetical protein